MPSHLRSIQSGPVQEVGLAEYVWIGEDGHIHSKSQVIPIGRDQNNDRVPFPENWTMTEKRNGVPVQRILRVAQYLPDPLRPQPAYVVLCEVMDLHDQPLDSNHRAKLRKVALDTGDRQETWWGFRQEYNTHGNSKDQMALWEHHLGTCLDAGLLIHSASWDIWDDKDHHWFKVGPRRVPNEIEEQRPVPLVVADHLVLGRYFLKRLALTHGVYINHIDCNVGVYFSTAALRDTTSDMDAHKFAEQVQECDIALQSRRGLDIRKQTVRAGASAPDRGFTYLCDLGYGALADPYEVVANLLYILHKEVPQ